MSFIIGIAPGAAGTVAILELDGSLVLVFDMPSVEIVSKGKAKRRVSPEMLAAELLPYNAHCTTAVVEQVGAVPGQGVSSTIAFGQAYGLALNVLAGMGIPANTVTPASWKHAMKLNTCKDAARAESVRRWPRQAGKFRRVTDDGKAEAALIALWNLNAT
jgi:crossover junction endodeoxyribonuclease RuvC